MKKLSDSALIMLLLMVMICAMVIALLGVRAMVREKQAVLLTKAVISAGSISDAFYEADIESLECLEDGLLIDSVMMVNGELINDVPGGFLTLVLKEGRQDVVVNGLLQLETSGYYDEKKDLLLDLEFSKADDMAILNMTYTNNGTFIYSLHCERYIGEGLI